MIRDALHNLHRPLSDTGLAASPLGLGTIKFGHDQGVKYSSGFAIPGNYEVASSLALACDLDISLIDTVPACGRSEERFGPLLRGQREHQTIVGKVGEESVDDQSVFDFFAARTRRSVERNLKCLGTERIEPVLVHSDSNDLDTLENNEVYPALAALEREDSIGAYGLSGKTIEGSLRTLREGDCAMITYNLNERAEHPVVEYAAARTRGILVKKALANGRACLGAGQDPVHVSFELVFDQSGVIAAIIGTINPLYLVHSVVMAAQTLKRA